MITSFRELVQRLLGVPSKHDIRPVNRTKFADGEVGRALRQQVPNFNQVRRPPFDAAYWAPSRVEFDEIVRADLTNRQLYQTQRYDCEDFAGSFMFDVRRDYGISTVGVVVDWSAAHAYNIVIFHDQTIGYYDPQDDTYVDPDPES